MQGNEKIRLNDEDLINRKTDKLIVIPFHPWTGAKFIVNCLGMHPKVILPCKVLADAKMNGKLTPEKSYNCIKALNLLSMKRKQHMEFVDQNITGGFDAKDLRLDPDFDLKHVRGEVFGHCEKPDDLNSSIRSELNVWSMLTKQDIYYFVLVHCIMSHDPYFKYENHKTIFLKNYKWILDIRQKSCEYTENSNLARKLKHYHVFDMSSILDEYKFKDSITIMLSYLDLESNKMRWDLLEKLRVLWLQVLPIGFPDWEKLYEIDLPWLHQRLKGT
jgi:hypothetical protein